VGIAISVVVTALSRVNAVAGWEKRVVDSFVYLRTSAPAPEIVLVVIDEDAFREMGQRQPLPRRYLADLGDYLLRSGARVVAFDIVLSARTEPAEDQALIAMSRRWERNGGGRLVFAFVAAERKDVRPERYETSPPFSPEVRAFLGFSNAPLGPDGMVRRMAPVLPAAEGGFLPSFALAAVAAYAGQTAESLARDLKGGDTRELILPARDPGDSTLKSRPISLRSLSEDYWVIDYAERPHETFTIIPSGVLIRSAQANATPVQDNPFRDRIVLIGATFLESRDFFPTPISLGRGMGPTAGVLIQANMVNTLLSRRALLPPPLLWNLSVSLAVCVVVALLSLWLRPVCVALLSLALIFGLVLGVEAYTRGGYWLDFVAPLVGMVAYLQGSRTVARRRLRAAFGQFVSPEVVSRIVREGAELGGAQRAVSLLMSDLRGFTTLSERLPPAQISEMMNEYFTAMVEVIAAHRGVVNDFVGDGILAVYGAPTDDAEHAWHAAATALEMQTALAGLNRRWQAQGRGPLAMGVAVHTGEVFAGYLGSPRRMKYAVLGDPVNTVARLEGLNRDLSTAILISGATLAAVKDRVEVRDRGSFSVKGRVQPVEVFELLDLRDGAKEPQGR
jgi:adenylate cyclase